MDLSFTFPKYTAKTLHDLAVICLVPDTTRSCKAARIDTGYPLYGPSYSYKTELSFNLTGNCKIKRLGTEKSSGSLGLRNMGKAWGQDLYLYYISKDAAGSQWDCAFC